MIYIDYKTSLEVIWVWSYLIIVLLPLQTSNTTYELYVHVTANMSSLKLRNVFKMIYSYIADLKAT